jgi:hypothetical protein
LRAHCRACHQLNLLAKFIAQQASPSDILVFIDGDAFPVKPIDSFIVNTLKLYPLAAIRRTENISDIQPHPSFCFTTVGFWESIGGDWAEGYQWETTAGIRRTDVVETYSKPFRIVTLNGYH